MGFLPNDTKNKLPTSAVNSVKMNSNQVHIHMLPSNGTHEIVKSWTGKACRSSGHRMRTALLGNGNTDAKGHLFFSWLYMWKCYIINLGINAMRRNKRHDEEDDILYLD